MFPREGLRLSRSWITPIFARYERNPDQDGDLGRPLVTFNRGEFEPEIMRWDPGDPGREAVLRLVGGSAGRSVEGPSGGVSLLAAYTKRQGLRLDPVMSVSRNGRDTAAAVALVAPGGSALVLLGPIDPPVGESTVLLRSLQRQAWNDGTKLLQALLPPEDTRTAGIFRAAGFEYLAELIYCDCDVSQPRPVSPACRDISYITYSSNLAELFIGALDASYVGSLDCPGLSGARDTRDVLLGHRHTGRHDPNFWFLAQRGSKSVGVLLLSESSDGSSVEVVYMGVAASERGHGIGGALLSLAIDVARRKGKPKLSLAVDSTNAPARRVYDRYGFVEVTRRRAWIARRSV